MEILVKRKYLKDDYTIGKLYIDGEYFCDTLEDTDRLLDDSDDIDYILRNKVFGKTAIPTGRYKITLDVVSPKYSRINWYKINMDEGRVPRLINVKGFEGILIHGGNTHEHTDGCILVGYNKKPKTVIDSLATLLVIYEIMYKVKDSEDIYITIVRDEQ